MKPTAPFGNKSRVFATTPWISSRFPASLVRFASSRSRTPAVLFSTMRRGLSLSRWAYAAQRQNQPTTTKCLQSQSLKDSTPLHHTYSPKGASRLIEFMSAAFEGDLISHEKRPDGAVMHATM